MNNYEEYHKSISDEFLASKNRVRYFIGNAHWGEDGRYKEVLLMNYLKKVLPSNVSIGTGFVKKGDRITSQIDLIIYNNSIPTLFSEGDFVIALSESVIGIIEVKSNISSTNVEEIIEKSNKNGTLIGENIFNGVFSFDSKFSFSQDRELAESIRTALLTHNGSINHLSFGANNFIKYWATGNPDEEDSIRCFSFYYLQNLSYGYFISNLIETVQIKLSNQLISSDLTDFLYPIENGKETKRLRNLELKLL
ncbi:DUF6602 domain-containing protein [Cytobacillus firmus]|uniref:DUF6602 domain-containing protein n=1 Tax=Cytobacillus firmus TaxID=1399 RepID=UPI001C98477A|nr:DUF6602 domain-containing protein [Cytobacillus firmus]MBY6053432.1 hypothetical protein [Cytobacillus firmus]